MGNITTETITALQAIFGNSAAEALAALLTHYSNDTANAVLTLQIKAQTTGDMATGFGPAISFIIRDSAGVDNEIIRIVCDRGSADNNGRLRVYVASAGVLTERFQISGSTITALGALAVYYGNLTSGNAGVSRGTVVAYHGASGNTPGYLATYSPNGTPWYWFAEDDGTAKISSAPPTQNSDGQIIGLQF